jgi:hypothetical protein
MGTWLKPDDAAKRIERLQDRLNHFAEVVGTKRDAARPVEMTFRTGQRETVELRQLKACCGQRSGQIKGVQE